jgi:RNA polymerase sigma-70 factor (ECF subfamily)
VGTGAAERAAERHQRLAEPPGGRVATYTGSLRSNPTQNGRPETVGRPAKTTPTQRQLDPEHLGDHLDRLYRAARGLCGSREDAEDLVQETYAQILKKPRFLRSEDDIRYLLRALRNTFVGTRRFASRRPQALPLPDELEIFPDVHSPRPDLQAEMSDVYAAIAALAPHFRDAIVAVDLVGLSYREAAQALRVREATITTRLHRARQQVARAVDAGPVPTRH